MDVTWDIDIYDMLISMVQLMITYRIDEKYDSVKKLIVPSRSQNKPCSIV